MDPCIFVSRATLYLCISRHRQYKMEFILNVAKYYTVYIPFECYSINKLTTHFVHSDYMGHQ